MPSSIKARRSTATSSGSSLGSSACHLDQADLRAQAAKGLGQLAADRPAAHDQEMIGQAVEIEDVLVGEIGHAPQVPGSGGRAGLDPVARTKRRARMRRSPAVTSRGPVKRARARITCTPSPAKRSCGIIGGDGLDHALDMGLDPGEIDHRRGLGEAKGGRPAIGRGGMGGGEQGLGGHAARIEAIAAHALGLDQHRCRAELAGACRRRPARRCRRR